MANNISVTQGSGTLITTEQCTADSSQMQVVRLAYSAAGVRTYIQGDVNGLLVNVSQVQGTVTVAGAVTISGTPAVTVTGVVSITGTPAVTISGTPAVTVSGTAAVTQSGSWNIGTVATITNPVTVTGTVTISGGSSVSGTVTANQGTAAAAASAWPVKISDGTNTAPLDGSNGNALKVSVVAQVGGGVSLADLAAFTGGTTAATPVQGVFNDSLAAVGSGHVAAVRVTAYRGQHVNLRDSAGNELGLVGAPVYVQVTGGIQPVSGTITATQGGAPWSFNHTQINGSAVAVAAAGVQTVSIVGAGGTAFSQVAPLQTQNAPSGGTGGAAQTPWKASVHETFTTSSITGVVVHTAAGGKTAYIEGYTLVVAGSSAGSYEIALYDNTNTATTLLWDGIPPAGVYTVTPARPIPLSATGNSLKFDLPTASSTVNLWVTAWGYDA